MDIKECEIAGVAIINLNSIGDERGFFARTFCHDEFVKAGLNPSVMQCNLSFNRFKGTLRGMHMQNPPKAECKLVRCVRGEIVDVAVDMRETSSTYLKHIMIELTAENRTALYIPEGFAHGFQTLTDDTEVCYQVSEFYSPESEAGLRFDDPKLSINWPLPVASISDKDAQWPNL